MTQSHLVTLACCIIFGVSVGAWFGWIAAASDNEMKEDTARTGLMFVFGGISAIVGIIAAVIMLLNGKWSDFLNCLLTGLAVLVIFAILFRIIVRSKRKQKYKKNPIVEEIANICKKHDEIRAIQCFSDRVVLFTKVLNIPYCRQETVRLKSTTELELQHLMQSYSRPASWKEYDVSGCAFGSILFKDRGYPEVEDLDLFAKALCSVLKGFGGARHTVEITHTTISYSGGEKKEETQYHTAYKDYFLYKKADMDELIIRDLERPKEKKTTPESTKKPASKPKSWE